MLRSRPKHSEPCAEKTRSGPIFFVYNILRKKHGVGGGSSISLPKKEKRQPFRSAASQVFTTYSAY
jgi:hypothetical protein